MIHPIADCEHPLMCLLGPGLVSQETAMSGSFQQNLASVCNGVSVWSCDKRMDHLDTALSRVPPHNQLPNADSIAYTSKILLKGPRHSCLL